VSLCVQSLACKLRVEAAQIRCVRVQNAGVAAVEVVPKHSGVQKA